MIINGCLYGLGLGPGDPELISLKAARLIGQVPVLAYFAKKGRMGHARRIVHELIPDHCVEIPFFYPITTEIAFDHQDYTDALAQFYQQSATQLAAILKSGQDVGLLCEGDPLLYSSFMHIFVRLRSRFSVHIVPGIPGMAGCWSAAALPMAWGDDCLSILPGTLPASILGARLAKSDAAVIMKIGSNFLKVRAAVEAAGLLERAVYVEYGSMGGEKVLPLAQKCDQTAPYFAMILIPGEGRRP